MVIIWSCKLDVPKYICWRNHYCKQ